MRCGKGRSYSTRRHSKSQTGSLEEEVIGESSPTPPPDYEQHPSTCPRIIDGVTYPGNIKEKDAAQEQYSAAVARGESAGLVK